MEDMARTEYPAMLASLQPNQAVQVLSDRVKRINKINLEIADWLQERRRVEEQYAMGLRRLGQLKAPNAQSDLGVFTGPWSRIVEATETIANSHHQLAERIERDVEQPLRSFSTRKDAVNLNTISSNLSTMAAALLEAQDKSEKLGRKGGKASAQKVDAASSKLESASQQWDSQAPFIFESLQAFDESRVNQLRDLLTQYQTHEADCAQRIQDNSADALAQVLEISSETEVHSFVNKTTAGRARLPTRASTRRSSVAGSSVAPSTGGSANLGVPVIQQPVPEPEPEPERPSTASPSQSQSELKEQKPESKLRRLGTMFGGRRRQSVHGGIGLSPQKSGSTFGRLTGGSKERPGVSPRASASNLHQENNRLGALAEAPDLPRTPEQDVITTRKPQSSHEGTNGFAAGDNNIMDSPVPTGLNGTHHDSTAANDTVQLGQNNEDKLPVASPTKDAEGFTIPAAANDPISEAQKEAAGEEADQFFKLNIQNKPVEEEDPDAKMAAFSNVANSLRLGPATRRSGTVRGRRDVRNTIYAPSPTTSETHGEMGSIPGIPGSASFASSTASRPLHIAALASEGSVAGTSDTQSVRSGNSLGGMALAKHPELTGPGLQASIIETVSVQFEDGEVKSASISGEIAFVSNDSDENMFKTHETIKINNFPNLERIGPNRIFVSNASIEQPDEFSLELSHIQKTATAFSYRVFAPEGEVTALAKHAPLLLRPAWKPQGDKLGLLLQYQLNPSCGLAGPVTLHNVAFVATYDGKASGAQTKPSGTHLKERHLVYWRLGDVTLTNEVQKIVCRIVGAEGVEPTPGHVEARWEYIAPASEDVPAAALASGISISRRPEAKDKGKEPATDDPFSDEGGSSTPADQPWVDVPLARKLVSGKYESK